MVLFLVLVLLRWRRRWWVCVQAVVAFPEASNVSECFWAKKTKVGADSSRTFCLLNLPLIDVSFFRADIQQDAARLEHEAVSLTCCTCLMSSSPRCRQLLYFCRHASKLVRTLPFYLIFAPDQIMLHASIRASSVRCFWFWLDFACVMTHEKNAAGPYQTE